MATSDLERMNYQGLTFLLFPPSMLSLYADMSDGSTARPHDVTDAQAATGADAVMDGPMFEKCDPGAGYASQSCGYVQYRHFDLSNGLNVASRYPGRGVTLSVLSDGSTQAAQGATVAPGATVAVQLYPELVANGSPVSVSNADGSASRAALAIMRDGRMAFVVSQPMLMSTFAQRLAGGGAVYAGYTDGGGSTSLGTAAGQYTGSAEHRRVLTWILAKARQSTVLAAIKQSPGTTAAVVLMLGGTGVLLWWMRRRK